jgi:HK97 family phage portal protein
VVEALVNVIARALASFKALTRMQWGRASSWFSMLLGSTTFDYRASTGDGRSNAAVMACVRWAQRALPEAPLQVVTRNAQDELKPAPDHALQALLDRPNAYYSGQHLLSALLADLMLTGNAYAVKIRSGNRRVVQLWWAPASLIEPRWPDNDPSVYISHYDYQVEGQVVPIDPADVVHVRQGFDPQNIRKGLSDLAALYREIATDNEGANWTAGLLRNGAVPGVIVSPEGTVTASDADLEGIKDKWVQRFGGDERGKPMVVGSPIKVQVLSFNPEQMKLRDVRIIPEERITAVLGIPAIVAGLGAGLQRSTFANYAEAREAAYESFIIPMQRLLCAELQMQLVPDFGDPATLRVQFDLSQVRVLQDDQNALHERARADLGAGLVTLNQALEMIGEKPIEGEGGDVRYVPNTVTVKTLDTLIPEEQPAALAEPTPLRALPAATEGDAAAGKGALLPAQKAAALSDQALLERFERGMAALEADLADDLLDAFEGVAEAALGRASSFLANQVFERGVDAILISNGREAAVAVGEAQQIVKGDMIAGLVTEADHEPIRRLLRSYVLKSMRQAAEDLAPLTGDVVRIQRNSPAVKAAVADMEARMPGIAATTGDDFGRLIRRLERRPGSVSLPDVRAALLEYAGEAYPARAEQIARTEGAAAHAAGVLLVAEESGIADRVHLADGDGDAACTARNGTVLTLEEARGVGLLHPNCRLRLIPVLAA